MKSIVNLIGAAIAYVAIATLLAQGVMFYWLWSKGHLDKDRLTKVVAILEGVDIGGIAVEQHVQEQETQKQPTLEQVARQRALATRSLELREQALEQGLQTWRFEMQQLVAARDEFQAKRDAFLDELKKIREERQQGGQAAVRATLEKSKAKQAKALIWEMLAREEMDVVVQLLAEMPVAARTKILAEFKTPEEVEKADEILRSMREGVPDSALADETMKDLDANRGDSDRSGTP